jgi:hypothetical protein
MTRPSKDIDQKLIFAARALVAEKGFGAPHREGGGHPRPGEPRDVSLSFQIQTGV